MKALTGVGFAEHHVTGAPTDAASAKHRVMGVLTSLDF
jgi:hypothetical protein